MSESKEPEVKRKKFEIKTHIDPYTGRMCKDVFVDDALFEWELDRNSWMEVCKMGPEHADAARLDIMRHFCESLSEFMGRKVGPGEVVRGFKTGWI